MKIDLEPFLIKPGKSPNLGDRSTNETQGYTEKEHEEEAKDYLKELIEEIDDLQETLYAECKQSLLFVFQAMDAGGKDSSIEKVFGGLNPQGVRVWNFKKPTNIELAHDFLWRVHRRVPGDGYIGVFNRSHYEDVLIVKVHQWADEKTIERRYDHIRNFESLLNDEGTRIVKVMLDISPEYQLERFRRRLRKPNKHWKFNPADLKERAMWPEYMKAFDKAIEETSTKSAPWYIVPAEERWFRDVVIAKLLRDTLRDMNPQYPAPTFDPAQYDPDTIE